MDVRVPVVGSLHEEDEDAAHHEPGVVDGEVVPRLLRGDRRDRVTRPGVLRVDGLDLRRRDARLRAGRITVVGEPHTGESGDEQDGAESGQGDAVEEVGDEEHAEGEECTVEDGAGLRFPAGVDVDAAADDDGGHGEPSEKAGHDVADALGEELAVGG